MSQSPEITLGSPAPIFRLPASTGGEIGLADYAGKSGVVLFFVREFNWMQCRVHAGQLGRLYPEFKASSAEIVVILGDTPQRARQYAESLKLPFPVLADVDRNVYHQFGLEKALLVIQRTASVIVDQGGVIRYLKQATNPTTWLAESRELLQAATDLANK